MSLKNLPEIGAFTRTDILSFEPDPDAEEKFVPDVVAAQDDEASISIYGVIGRDFFSDVDNTERRIGAALRTIGKKDVTVSINSPGGNFFTGLAIYNLLRAHPAKVTINVISVAGSAASVIAMAGDEILMADGSFIMVHKAAALIDGNEYVAKDAAELLREVDDAMASVYAARANVDKTEALSWMDKGRGKGTWFGTTAAIKNGLADGVLPSNAVRVSADAAKDIPPERLAERALMAQGKSSSEAKALIATMKSGTRDAAASVTRDADELKAAIEQLRSTIKS